MHRRSFVRLAPLTIAGITARAGAVHAELPAPYTDSGVPLAMRYIDRVAVMLTYIRESQSTVLMEAAHVIARTIERGNHCWSNWNMGHNQGYDLYEGRNGAPAFFTQGLRPEPSEHRVLLDRVTRRRGNHPEASWITKPDLAPDAVAFDKPRDVIVPVER